MPQFYESHHDHISRDEKRLALGGGIGEGFALSVGFIFKRQTVLMYGVSILGFINAHLIVHETLRKHKW